MEAWIQGKLKVVSNERSVTFNIEGNGKQVIKPSNMRSLSSWLLSEATRMEMESDAS